ncbi:hypothetical protein NCAS_0B00910 [Naumovozyma castellii]|uniref:Uncharacterized protein n=1 Tax=Naumovozyma castellii TaxID=27288 RepID=G0VB52_NAUCA|nr:hypothetical protein NCAS_0B00910 [Naumovozyma castellii CBS 4309]CCC68175.1 hypothetical protein NCAS_0B00910 [Naumovozyma castellii CBS 4309]
MDHLKAPEPLLLSTPRSKLITDVSLPITPNKRLRSLDPLSISNLTPSKKSAKLARPSFRTSSYSVKPQVLTFNTFENMDSDLNINKNIYDDILSHRLNLDGDSTSDFGSISPLSDISSVPSSSSSSPDIACSDQMDPFSIDTFNWTGKHLMNKETLELNRMIQSSMLKLDHNVTLMPPIVRKSHPCHRTKTPTKRILNLETSSLNLIVSSSRGSLKDATIFATEINASAHHEDNKLPVISNVWERITIPVNSSIKEKHKKLKERFLKDNDLENESSDDFDSEDVADFPDWNAEYESVNNWKEIPDAALIRGYDFEYLGGKETFNKKTDTTREKKRVKWAEQLEC